MNTNNQPGNDALKRFGIPALLLVVGFLLGGLHISTLNGHGPEAGFQGLAEALIVVPAITGICLLVGALGNGTRVGKYASLTGIFFLAVELGLLFGGHFF